MLGALFSGADPFRMSAPSSAPGMPTGAASLAGAKQRFSRNAGWNLANFLTQAAASFIVTPILVHGLGNVEYGIWALIGQAVTSMDLLDFGLSVSVGRYFAQHHARDDRDEMNRLLSTGFALSLVPCVLALVIGAALVVWAPPLFHFPAALDAPVRVAIALLTLAAAAMFPGTMLTTAVTALSRYDLLALRNILWISIRATLYWVVLARGSGLVGVASVALAVELAGLTLGAVWSLRLVPWIRLHWREFSMPTLKPLLSFSAFAFLLSIASRLIFTCDNIVVGAVLGPLAVAYYSVAGGLVDRMRGSLKIVTTLYSALAAQIHAIEGERQMQRLFVAGSRLALLLVLPACIGMCWLGPEFLGLWLGPVYRANSSEILAVLTVVIGLYALSVSCTQILYGINRHRYNAMVSLGEAGANLALSLVLVHTWGAIGVAWGTLLPALVCEAVLLPLYTLRQLHLGVMRYVSAVILRPLLVGLPMAAWCWGWHASGRITGWGGLVAVVAAAVIIFGLALRAYGMQAEERRMLHHSLRRLSPDLRRVLIGPAAGETG